MMDSSSPCAHLRACSLEATSVAARRDDFTQAHRKDTLITEIFLDIPRADESLSTGVKVGLILTLPSTGEGLHM